MTVQTGETLLYEGQEYWMENHPLAVYIAAGARQFPFMVQWTACWRGYQGTWKLDEGKLRLVALSGYLAKGPAGAIAHDAFREKVDWDDPNVCRRATLQDVFPGFTDQVFAHWYTGTIEATNNEDDVIRLVATIRRGVAEDINLVSVEGDN